MIDTYSTIKHIENAITGAEQEHSKLTPEAFEPPGFTSPKIRHFLNNLGTLSNLHYLEIGVHKGATFVATNFQNNLLSSVAVDNWSEFAQDGFSKNEFSKYCTKLLNPASYQFFETDCFTMTKEQLPNLINLYFYDGCHSYEAQLNALTYFYPFLDDTFIFLVDDWNWPDPKAGTKQSISNLNLKIILEKELTEGWWNGFYISLLQK
jgi:hypothetical protein